MGGKKQAQRTKGNTKPSSSLRAAELLEASGAAAGFNVGVQFAGVDSALANDDSIESSDADFNLIIKRMSKKDSTTKLKAMHDFARICQEKDVKVVVSVLPLWPKVYAKLSIDLDSRVREATHKAFGQLVNRVGRGLAHHLRSLMGPWLVAQCDSYAPAASAAVAAFQSAFSPVKQREAIAFCRVEVMDHIEDNLLRQTPMSLSDPRTTTEEEREDKYHRLLAASLQSFSMFLVALSDTEREEAADSFRPLLKNAKFWKFGKHAVGAIRVSFFGVMSTLCSKCPSVAIEFSDQMCPGVLYLLDETEPAVMTSLWQAVLHVVVTLPDWWSKVNIRKAVYPKLWCVLREGGRGCAAAVFHNLLPLLSRLPSELQDHRALYQQFIGNVHIGLMTDRVQLSPAECNAVVSALMECSRYVLSRCFTCEPSDVALCQYIVSQIILPVFESTLREQRSSLSNSAFYAGLVDLLVFLRRTATDDRQTDVSRLTASRSVYDTLTSEISQSVLAKLETGDEVIVYRLGTFFVRLVGKSSVEVDVSGTEKVVRFVDSSTAVASGEEVQTSKPEKTEGLLGGDELVRDDESALWRLTCESCWLSFCLVRSQSSRRHLQFLAAVLGFSASDRLLTNLVMRAELSPTSDASSCWNFLSQMMLPLVDECHDDEASHHVLCIMTSVYSRLQPHEQVLFAKEIARRAAQNVICSNFLGAIVSSTELNGELQLWLHGSEFGTFAVELMDSICQRRLTATQRHQVPDKSMVNDRSMDDSHWALLCACLTLDQKSEPIIAPRHVADMSVQLGDMLTLVEKTLLETDSLDDLDMTSAVDCLTFVCQFVSHYFTTLGSSLPLQSANSLTMQLFRLDVSQEFDAVVVGQLRSAWQHGLTVACDANDRELRQHVDEMMAVVVARVGDVDDLSEVYRLSEILSKIWHSTVSDSCQSLDVRVMKDALRSSSCVLLQSPWLLAAVLDRSLFVRCLDAFRLPALTDSVHETRSTAVAALTARFLLTSWKTGRSSCTKASAAAAAAAGDEDEDDNATVDKTNMNEELNTSCLEMLIDISVAVVYIQASQAYVSQWPAPQQELQQDFCNLIGRLSDAEVEHLIGRVMEQSMTGGEVWSLALDVVLRQLEVCNKDIVERCLSPDTDQFLPLTLSSASTQCAILPRMSREMCLQVADVTVALLLTCDADRIAAFDSGAVTCLIVLNNLLQMHDVDSETSLSSELIHSVIALMKQWRSDSDEIFLLDADIVAATNDVVAFNVELVTFMSEVISRSSSVLTADEWDFILCSLVAWFQSVKSASLSVVCTPCVMALMTALSRLLRHTAVCIQHVVPQRLDTYPSSLITEWQDVFSMSLYEMALSLFVMLAYAAYRDLWLMPETALCELGAAVSTCSIEHLLTDGLLPKPVANDNTVLSDPVETVLNHLSPLLTTDQRSIRHTVYHLLTKLVPRLTPDSTEMVPPDDQDSEVGTAPPAALLHAVDDARVTMDVVVDEHSIGETATVSPAHYAVVSSYLLAWNVLLSFFRCASAEHRVEYARYIRRVHLVDRLMSDVFRLLPNSPIIAVANTLLSSPSSNKMSSSRNLVADEPLLDIRATTIDRDHELRHIVCCVYVRALETLPALVRQWWTGLDKRSSDVVDRFTSRYASPVLCSRELSSLQGQHCVPGLTVRARPAAREVLAGYMVGDVAMELTVTLAANMPLGQITVTGDERRAGVQKNQWRKWMLQLTAFLTYQNGSLVDGLQLWKRNVDKHFEGVDECYICYSVLHGSSYQLPRKQCRTCRKRFHAECLYRWFDTSNNSACPLCRNLF